MLLAAALRLHGIDRQPPWYDELATQARVDGRLGALFDAYAPDVLGPKPDVFGAPPRPIRATILEASEPIPPLHALAVRAAQSVAGPGVRSLRAPSCVASILLVALGMALGWTISGARAGLLSGLLLALAPFEIFYAQESRPYALLSLLSLAATLAICTLARTPPSPGTERRRAALWVVYAVSLAAAFATHYAAVTVGAAHLAWFLAAGRPAALRRLPIAWALAALLCAPLARLTIAQVTPFLQVSGITSGAQATEATGFLAARAHVVGAPGTLLSAFTLNGPSSALGLGIGFAALALHGLAIRRGIAGAGLLAATAFAGPVAMIGFDLATGGNGSSTPRYAAASVAPLWVGAAVGIAALSSRRAAILAAALCIVLAPRAFATGGCPKSLDFAGAARVIDELRLDERDLLLTQLGWPQRAVELDVHLRSAPSTYRVYAQFDTAILQRPWRSLTLVFSEDRREVADALSSAFARRFPDHSEGAIGGLVIRRFRP